MPTTLATVSEHKDNLKIGIFNSKVIFKLCADFMLAMYFLLVFSLLIMFLMLEDRRNAYNNICYRT